MSLKANLFTFVVPYLFVYGKENVYIDMCLTQRICLHFFCLSFLRDVCLCYTCKCYKIHNILFRSPVCILC